MRVMTFNARLKGEEENPENNWCNRFSRFVQQIKILNPDILGLQEVRKSQFEDLEREMGDYGYEYLPRDGKRGEGTPVYYKKEKFTLINKGSYFLNEHPETCGIGWDARCLRVASYVTLKDNETGKKFTFFNTHLDHIGVLAQKNGIKLMVDKMRDTGGSMILTGDFNVYEGSETYEVASSFLNDAKYQTSDRDDGFTFHGYGTSTSKSPIDYIFVSSDIVVKEYRIYDKKTDGGYASDHYAVYADVTL